MTDKLKPCPFCGEEAEVDDICRKEAVTYIVDCTNKKCRLYEFYTGSETGRQAVNVWNKRVSEEDWEDTVLIY